MAEILIIDDNQMLCNLLTDLIKDLGHTVVCAFTLEEGLKRLSVNPFDVVFLDVLMPDGNGLEVLPRIRQAPSSPEVIIITGSANTDGAELAIKNGAWDYIEKTSSLKEMVLPLVRALQYREEKNKKPLQIALKVNGLVGGSSRMKSCFDTLARAASCDANVLITGETGTGKELFAYAIHANSARSDGSFVVVDCAALPENLVESILFGHEKGAFTGADRSREGLIKQADGGTLFLDEVGELPLELQKTFLRAIQERRFRPVGGKAEVTSHFRLLAATNQDLDQMVLSNLFRKDFLFRLRSIEIHLPPLRERPEDVRDLIFHFTTKLSENYRIGTKGFSPEFLEMLYAYDWPGNVRELIYTLEHALAMGHDDPILFPRHLPDSIRIQVTQRALRQQSHPAKEGSGKNDLRGLKEVREKVIAQTEGQYLQELMVRTGGSIEEACRISRLSQARLYALLHKYRINKKYLSSKQT